MIGEFPRPGKAMMEARRIAFDGHARPHAFELGSFIHHDVHIDPNHGASTRARLIDTIVDSLATPPDGVGPGYCLVSGISALESVDNVRRFSAALLVDVWAGYRARSTRITADRDFHDIETLSSDGAIPVELFGSRWSFKPPHADRNGVLFAHVYGPNAGFIGGDVYLIDALAYTKDLGLTFRDAIIWSDDTGEQKPVLRSEHVHAALSSHGRRFGQLGPDRILLVNNGPEGLFHGATHLDITDSRSFVRYLHRVVVRERDE